MKKKILAISLVIAMLAIAIVGGSLAWFTAEDEVTNTFTVGSIEIQQNEKDENGNDFVQDQVLLPIVNVDDPAADPSYIAKVVTVDNIGKNDAYIRTFIAVPKALENYIHLDVNTSGNWVEQWAWPVVTVDGIEYVVHCYVCNAIFIPGETTEVLLKGVYMDAKVDVKLNEASGKEEFCLRNDDGTYSFSGYAVEDATKVSILVATQAVQAQGFNDPQQALNSAFGEPNYAESTPFYAG